MAYTPDDITNLISAIGSLAVNYNNNSPLEEAAVEAAVTGRPAFWTTSKYHNQAALTVAMMVNAGHSIGDSLAQVRAEPGNDGARSVDFLLGTLIPINEQGIDLLERARV